jgi:hypothetical protein
MTLLYLLFLSGLASAQYTVDIYPTTDCGGTAVLQFAAGATCNSYTASDTTQWSWRVLSVIDATHINVQSCKGSLNCFVVCATAVAQVGTGCNNWQGVTTRFFAGNPSATNASATTAPGGNGTTAPAGGGAGGMCFQESTRIQYGDEQLLMGDPGSCRIPHILEGVRDGVIIKAGKGPQLSLRVTAAHLIYTKRGLVRADEVRAHLDVVFGDLDERQPYLVNSVERETSPQRYFGLNCPWGSDVIANGIKTSTFDTLHTLPAAWMRIMSGVVGVDRASRWGEGLAILGKQLGIV